MRKHTYFLSLALDFPDSTAFTNMVVERRRKIKTLTSLKEIEDKMANIKEARSARIISITKL